MVMALESIRELVEEDLTLVDDFIISQLESHIPLIKQIIEYVLTCGGKRIRPLILILSARALGNDQQSHINLASVIELIHTATLLHDDVVDSSTMRRGHQTTHTIWGKNASVLVGDFLYSRAFQIVVDLRHEKILDIFAKATHYIAEGEILQLVNCHDPNTTEAFYFDIIKRKTAKLFEIATELGALITSTNSEDIHALRSYGLHLGLAYQLIDDALDYSQSEEITGKKMGQDLADGKTTLPLIYAMQQSGGSNLTLLRQAIKKGNTANLDRILEIIESTGAITYTANKAKLEAIQAKSAIAQLAETPYREALMALTDFVVERHY